MPFVQTGLPKTLRVQIYKRNAFRLTKLWIVESNAVASEVEKYINRKKRKTKIKMGRCPTQIRTFDIRNFRTEGTTFQF